MKSEESRHYADWFKIGDEEIRRSQALLSLDDMKGAAFNLQQAIEKYLKGYLLYQGWELRRIHNLESLLNAAVTYEASLEEFRESCQMITHYYLINRYPLMVDWELTKAEMERFLAIAEQLFDKLRSLIEG